MKPAEDREIVLFREALQRAKGPERDVFLDQACAGNETLRGKLEALLQAQENPAPPLEPTTAPQSTVTVLLPIEEGPGTLIGRYKILERIGEGGFGLVYVGEQREPVKRRVALKIIKLGMDTKQVVARFEAERQALALMDHPNIAKVLDAGATDTGRPFFVMELVKGIPITRYCDQEKLATRERLDLFIMVCHAIQHAHQKGIIHRDIKPSNMLVTLQDGVPVPKVIDFGIAKATQQELTEKTVYTQFQQFIGTPAYMSPEQAEMSGLDIDTRSDIYSLGVLLYELLTGTTPFDTKELLQSGLDEMRKIIREREPVWPSTRLGQTWAAQHPSSGESALRTPHSAIDTDLDWIVMRCLEKDRTRRYETANGLAMDLKRHLNHEPVLARPPSIGYRLQKGFRRNKLVFTATGVVGFALVLGVVVSSWQLIRAQRAERVATTETKRARVQRQRADEAAQVADSQKERAEKEANKARASELVARAKAYSSDMNLLQQALAANNLGLARDLLHRQLPAASELDLRGWEWRYLWQYCQSDALSKLCQKTNSIFSLSVSRDGRWLAIGEAENGGFSIWDLSTRRETPPIPAGEGWVRTAFSPRESLLAFSSETGLRGTTDYQCTVHLWSVDTRRSETEIPLDNRCLGLAFAEDGRTLVALTAGAAGRLTLWRVPGGQKVASYLAPQTPDEVANPFAVARDLSVAAVGQNPIRLLDLSTGKERWTALPSNDFFIRSAFSPDGKVLVASQGIVGTTLHFWDVASGKEIAPPRHDHPNWVSQFLFSADGSTLVTASADQTIRLWDATDLTQVRPRGRPLRGHSQEVWSLAMLPDQHTLVSGCKDGSVFFWDSAAPRDPHAQVTLPVKISDQWSFTPDSKSLVALDREFQVARWQGDDFQDRKALFEVGTNVTGGCFSEGGRLFASGSANGLVRIWEVQRCAVVHESKLEPDTEPIWLSTDGQKLVVAAFRTRIAHLWNLATEKEMHSWAMPADASSGAVSADEHWWVLIGFAGASYLQDLVNGTQTSLPLDIRQGRGQATFSPDGKLFAAPSEQGYARIWETANWREVNTVRGVLLGVHSAAFSPDGTRLATGSNGQEAVKLWDTARYQDLLTLPGSSSLFLSTAFSPDANVIGSVNYVGVLHLWRAPSWEEIAAAEKRSEGKTEER
jgi:WD40 repeat protein/tRNA A-37 threonylcarbamoyl transferase component Bud32